MLTLYGVYRSRASRPIWMLNEIGMPFNHVPVIQAYRLADPKAADAPFNTASPAYLAIAPQGQIPAMVDDGLVLTESLAITLYIGRKHGGLLGPQNDAETALSEQWALFAATAIETPALEMFYILAAPPPLTPEAEATVALNAERLRRPLARLDAHLTTHPFMLNDRFTAADIVVAECLRYAQGHPTLLAEFPAAKAWLETCQARPAFQSMWAARLAEPA
jgi:glutathione S-transferase